MCSKVLGNAEHIAQVGFYLPTHSFLEATQGIGQGVFSPSLKVFGILKGMLQITPGSWILETRGSSWPAAPDDTTTPPMSFGHVHAGYRRSSGVPEVFAQSMFRARILGVLWRSLDVLVCVEDRREGLKASFESPLSRLVSWLFAAYFPRCEHSVFGLDS